MLNSIRLAIPLAARFTILILRSSKNYDNLVNGPLLGGQAINDGFRSFKGSYNLGSLHRRFGSCIKKQKICINGQVVGCEMQCIRYIWWNRIISPSIDSLIEMSAVVTKCCVATRLIID